MGKTSGVHQIFPERWKHPHVHGEDSVCHLIRFYARETPPRAWGRLFPSQVRPLPRRNTPTCMGKTTCCQAYNSVDKKHPHVHGEDCERVFSGDFDVETPPRAWGRLRLLCGFYCRNEKHPHVHGEDAINKLQEETGEETPPRAWGRLRFYKILDCFLRNTPTCMGKTPYLQSNRYPRWKHPHVHGEDLFTLYSSIGTTETPPRAWGRQDRI